MMASKSVRVDAAALQALKGAVYARYGQLYGVLQREASQALFEHAARLTAAMASESAQEES
jgi:hypothetical protein